MPQDGFGQRHGRPGGALPVVHQPVKTGDCLPCHNPHGGKTSELHPGGEPADRVQPVPPGRGGQEEARARAGGGGGLRGMPQSARVEESQAAGGAGQGVVPDVPQGDGRPAQGGEGDAQAGDGGGMQAVPRSARLGLQDAGEGGSFTLLHELPRARQDQTGGAGRQIQALDRHAGPGVPELPHATRRAAVEADEGPAGGRVHQVPQERRQSAGRAGRKGVPEVVDPKLLQARPRAGRNCSGCHNVHGSDVSRLSIKAYPETFYVKYDPDNFALCFSCHDKKLVETKEAEGADGVSEWHAEPALCACGQGEGTHLPGVPRDARQPQSGATAPIRALRAMGFADQLPEDATGWLMPPRLPQGLRIRPREAGGQRDYVACNRAAGPAHIGRDGAGDRVGGCRDNVPFDPGLHRHGSRNIRPAPGATVPAPRRPQPRPRSRPQSP